MYYLERKEYHQMPNILGNTSFPVHSHRWKAIAACEELEPLKREMEGLDRNKYRIMNNVGEIVS